jgi:DNA-binding MarR family transcriptional regulator
MRARAAKQYRAFCGAAKGAIPAMNRDTKHSHPPRGIKRKRARQPAAAILRTVRYENIGRLFLMGSRLFERYALAEWRNLGFNDLRLVHLPLIRDLPAEGIRTTEIAEIMRMTKQAVGQLTMELEELGYVVRLPDPTDGRAKLVRYAPRGKELVAIIPQVIMRAEAKIKAAVGAEDFLTLRRALKRLSTIAED